MEKITKTEQNTPDHLLTTGIFLQMTSSIINVRSANPDIDGKSTSVNIRSTFCGPPFSASHAFKPSETATTGSTKKRKVFLQSKKF